MAHEAEPVTIYHNPGCGTSRRVLEEIERAGIRPTVVRYLQTGWTRASLNRLLDALAVKPSAILRTSSTTGALVAEKEEAEIFEALLADPSLTERPIVVTSKGAALCRPADRLKAIL